MKRDYAATVDYLFGRLPMYQRTGTLTGKLDLSKTLALLEALGNPHLALRCVHVGGTNGKGTVSHTVAGLLTASGRRTGLYTSPHYVDYRERIRIDGDMIGEAYVVDFVATHEALIEALEVSFFEFTVALAFAYFAEQRVDVAVIEVGLGGRLDSTNVIETPLVSVITNIDLDHTEILGATIEAIAVEKAGIIKANRPVVIGRYQPETWPVFRGFAERLGSKLLVAAEVVSVRAASGGLVEFEYRGETSTFPADSLSVRGPFAAENLQTALAAYHILQEELDLDPPPLRALAELSTLTGYTGRFLTLSQNPLVLTDAGHNAAAWKVLVPEVVALNPQGTCHVVCGFVRGKTPGEFLSLWPRGTQFYLGDLDLPRNRPVAETLAEVQDLDLSIRGFASIPLAFRQASKEAAHGDLVFVGGSSFVVGALLAVWPVARED